MRKEFPQPGGVVEPVKGHPIGVFRQRIFRTAAGLRLLDSIYLQDERGA